MADSLTRPKVLFPTGELSHSAVTSPALMLSFSLVPLSFLTGWRPIRRCFGKQLAASLRSCLGQAGGI